jgi:hypothetical protein
LSAPQFDSATQLWYVTVLAGYETIKGPIDFYVKATALGGETAVSPKMTLDLQCGPNSAIFTSSLPAGSEQTQNVGDSNAMFLLPILTASYSSDCPITTSIITSSFGSTAQDSRFLNSLNPHLDVDGAGNYKIKPSNFNLVGSISFYFGASTGMGEVFWTGPYTLTLICNDAMSVAITSVATVTSVVHYYDSNLASDTIPMYPFVVSDGAIS